MGVGERLYGIYDAIVERPALARPFGRALWGADVRMFYAAHAEVATVAHGGTILDVPCGGGVAFRHVPPGRGIRYLAVDLAPEMLERARAEGVRRGIEGAEFLRADVAALPVDDDSVDLCLTSAGLHCFPDPRAAVREMARCLRPGGRLVATTAVRGAGVRQDRPGRALPADRDLRTWRNRRGPHGLGARGRARARPDRAIGSDRPPGRGRLRLRPAPGRAAP